MAVRTAQTERTKERKKQSALQCPALPARRRDKQMHRHARPRPDSPRVPNRTVAARPADPASASRHPKASRSNEQLHSSQPKTALTTRCGVGTEHTTAPTAGTERRNLATAIATPDSSIFAPWGYSTRTTYAQGGSAAFFAGQPVGARQEPIQSLVGWLRRCGAPYEAFRSLGASSPPSSQRQRERNLPWMPSADPAWG